MMDTWDPEELECGDECLSGFVYVQIRIDTQVGLD